MEGDFIVGLLKLILINIVLSGDNAVVIALACRNLPAHQQKKAILWGSFGAIGLRIVLTFIAVWLLQIPFLQVAGGLLLIWIAIKLLKGDGEEEHLKAGTSMAAAIKTIIVADFVMSLDNVLAVAGAAGGNYLLIILGLAISIPLIIWGSQLLMALMSRFPIIVLLGAALLGYTAGEMALTDKAVGHFIETAFPIGHYILPIGLAILVVVVGKLLGRKNSTLVDQN
ncbi:TerC family protein [Ammoniphilus resinae]|uniref:YjbE family integral membrane protein n=1 Tax=Ammoniphilus resinae TaxID=861532 RepID=A0ABS4GLB0_9BACL|nr:TerC family protein [Ammoniphilus resinae]MBP1931058.1 YjbE family integral membrane protein [Ammoniphilus resinae]